ncbi:MAG TPA: LLM class F420-dependent oxidoreductase [Microthrixaceae bacterium]|jgi:probable F420-dependent oxidoreductase|nr:LLM class F420-dependent oxidoreductase [Microthrixaceae bacterium]HQF96192.1 LLM class F420-dependent oxidoreductase [Microthrixaceae bacterium]
MRYGIVFANTGPLGTAEGAVALAEACDAHGVESVWTVEHVLVPGGYESEYPYSSTGKMPGSEDSPIPDPLIWLTWVAANSSKVRLGTGVLILPQRNPAVLAKEVATLDALSKGRVELGIGVGWLEEEFDALGVPFDRRGQRTDEYIAALREMWTTEETSFAGEFVNWERVMSFPKPHDGSPPIVVGGHSHAAARRAGRLGDGFFPGRQEILGELIETMRTTAESAGRDPDAIEITTGAAMSPEKRQALVELGVSRMVFPPPAFTPDEIGPAIERTLDFLS